MFRLILDRNLLINAGQFAALKTHCSALRSFALKSSAAPIMPANFSDAEQRAHDPTAHEQRFDCEKHVQRNPHPDFSKVQASRPDWHEDREWHFTKTPKPDWKLGDGANDGGKCLEKEHVEIDPYEEGRPAVFNYKLLISGIIPRPIGFIGTQSKDGRLETLYSLAYSSVLADADAEQGPRLT